MESQSLPLTAGPAFDYKPRTRIVFGPGTAASIGELARELGGSRLLLVTDAGIVAAGHAARVTKLLEAAGLSVASFDAVEENPTTVCVDKCVAVARETGADLLVGLGGGSSIDTAKGCNFILTNGGRMRDYLGMGKAKHPMLPLIAVPTTGGTGSECQSFALISEEGTHQKMACGDPKAAARIALLDPELTVSQPFRVSACTGVDAIAHALEAAVTRKRNSISELFSREAFRLTISGLPRVLTNPEDMAARSNMLLGAAWAGTAIENSMLGAAHSSANPLTAHFNVVHGHAVGLMLPHVIRYNCVDPDAARIYSQLALLAGLVTRGSESGAEVLAREVERLLHIAKMPLSLRAVGVGLQDLPVLAREAAAQWTAQFNPRQITEQDFERLYTNAF